MDRYVTQSEPLVILLREKEIRDRARENSKRIEKETIRLLRARRPR